MKVTVLTGFPYIKGVEFRKNIRAFFPQGQSQLSVFKRVFVKRFLTECGGATKQRSYLNSYTTESYPQAKKEYYVHFDSCSRKDLTMQYALKA